MMKKIKEFLQLNKLMTFTSKDFNLVISGDSIVENGLNLFSVESSIAPLLDKGFKINKLKPTEKYPNGGLCIFEHTPKDTNKQIDESLDAFAKEHNLK